MNGDLSEVVLYNTALTSTDRQKIESYLAIKYGITLDQSSGGYDYLSSTGATIYPATTSHANYLLNIAGIAKDNGSGINSTCFAKSEHAKHCKDVQPFCNC
ncbi:MAG: hypothetical protein WDO15_01530 [Bacteroidota bacterium]